VRPLLQPGSNCCAVAHARRVALLVDGEDYFRAFWRAAQRAERSIVILSWDFDSRTRLHFDEARPGDPPALLGEFLNFLVRRRRGLQIHILNWDYPLVFGTDRETRPLYGFGWEPARRVHLRYDDTHPFTGSQHQKVVVIDDAIAFSGGMDITLRRWDTPEHRADEPRRSQDGAPYPPVHDVMIAVDGEAARALGNVARARWLRGTGERLRPAPAPQGDPWPAELNVDMAEVEVGIARTLPPHDETPAVREVEQLYLDTIGAARHSLYIENQYFTSPVIARALEQRLGEADGPEIVLVLRLHSHGWLEENTMHVLRTRLLSQLLNADRHHRLRIVYPYLPGAEGSHCLDVHSKVMVVDDSMLRVGSSNLSSRSLGVDTECDLLIEARGRPAVVQAIRAFRERLMAEHLGCPREQLRARLDGGASLRDAVDALSAAADGGRTLRPLEDIPEHSETVRELASVADPAEPIARDFLELAPPAEPERDAGPAWGRLAAIAAVIAACAALWRFTPLAQVASAQNAIAWAKELGNQPWVVLAIALAYTPACFVMFPRPLITLFSVIALGPWLAFGTALTGIVFSAAVTYFVGMHLRRDTVRRLAGDRMNRMIDVLRRHGLLAMTLLRLVPLAPFAVEGIVAGAVRLKLWHLLAGTAIGMLPGTLATTLFGEQVEIALSEGGRVNWWVIVGIGAVLVCGSFAVRRWFRKMAGGPAAPAAPAAGTRNTGAPNAAGAQPR
jgi:phospholipase D1/2